MKIIDPWIKVEKFDGLRIMKNIEKACRTCYRSEGLITDTSYEKLIKNCINRQHGSVMEHEKISVRICCDIGFYKDITRHRAGTAFSIESTRWCNYGKDKFENEIKFIKPIFYDEKWTEHNYEGSPFDNNEQLYSSIWYNCMQEIEDAYIQMSNNGAKPDELRMLLPHSTAAEVTMTCNIREWRHILSLRCAKMTHPSIRQILIPLLLYFKQEMPCLFEDIEYDTDFDSNKYAELKIEED